MIPTTSDLAAKLKAKKDEQVASAMRHQRPARFVWNLICYDCHGRGGQMVKDKDRRFEDGPLFVHADREKCQKFYGHNRSAQAKETCGTCAMIRQQVLQAAKPGLVQGGADDKAVLIVDDAPPGGTTP